MSISGGTRLAAVIGSPVKHSLSPAIHNAAFAARGLDWTFVAFDVPSGGGAAAVAGVRALGLGGLSVTMPLKAEAATAVDVLSDDARALGAVNCVVPDASILRGENTDGAGFVDALRIDEGVDPAGLRCVVLGAGGAARAVIRALGGAGAAAVLVVNRTPSNAADAALLAGDAGAVADVSAVDDADLVVNATPAGMRGGPDHLPVDPERFHAGQIVMDLVYRPAGTPLLAAAGARGARTIAGDGMLVHQAAHAFRLWTGEEAPVGVMAAAMAAALAGEHGR